MGQKQSREQNPVSDGKLHSIEDQAAMSIAGDLFATFVVNGEEAFEEAKAALVSRADHRAIGGANAPIMKGILIAESQIEEYSSKE